MEQHICHLAKERIQYVSTRPREIYSIDGGLKTQILCIVTSQRLSLLLSSSDFSRSSNAAVLSLDFQALKAFAYSYCSYLKRPNIIFNMYKYTLNHTIHRVIKIEDRKYSQSTSSFLFLMQQSVLDRSIPEKPGSLHYLSGNTSVNYSCSGRCNVITGVRDIGGGAHQSQESIKSFIHMMVFLSIKQR